MKRTFERREILAGMFGGAVLAACDPTTGSTNDTGDYGSDGDTAIDDTGESSLTTTWATGGTASIGARYAVAFDDTCSQTCELTLGPCYAETEVRKDISEGVDGLPTRIVFKLVDTDCNPVEGAVVDIWHCDPEGVYSGADAASMCTGNDSEARASKWFRGQQPTDADGLVEFDTCFPGWYSGRAVHIHFQVLVDGNEYVISQLGFPEALNADVFTNHPVYSPSGTPDTPNNRDNILNGDADYLFDWRQADDGVLVLWKTLTIRKSRSDSTC